MSAQYTIGLDYGTNSVRALIVNVANGAEVATAVWNYAHGTQGVILSRDPNLARQHPADYVKGAEITIKQALADGEENPCKGFNAGPGHRHRRGHDRQHAACPWTRTASRSRSRKNSRTIRRRWRGCGRTTPASPKPRRSPRSPKKCARNISPNAAASIRANGSGARFCIACATAPEVFNAAHSWVELADYVPAALTGTEAPDKFIAGVCAAGHKAMWNANWGGYPDAEFLSKLNPEARQACVTALTPRVHSIDRAVGGLTPAWAKKTGLTAGIPVAVGAFDAHLGAVGCRRRAGHAGENHRHEHLRHRDCAEHEKARGHPGSLRHRGRQRAARLFRTRSRASRPSATFSTGWSITSSPAEKNRCRTLTWTTAAAKLKPGESGLLALDWNNGNRTILVDQRLTGLLVGQTLYTTPAEIYRALIEATAFGALTIINRFEEYGVKIASVVNCGGIAEKSPLTMQIYADVTGRPMKVSRSAQTCALGSAIAAAVVAGAHKDFATAQKAMTGLKPKIYKPDPEGPRGLPGTVPALPQIARRLRHGDMERQSVRHDEETD